MEGISLAEESIVTSVKQGDDDELIRSRFEQESLKILRRKIVAFKEELDKVGIDPLRAYRKSKESVLFESGLRAANLNEFIKRTGLYGPELWARLTPKIKSEFAVQSDKIGLRGIVDQIEYFDEEIIPVELKTGAVPKEGVWDSHKIQLGAYIIILRESTGKIIRKGYVRYLDSGERRDVVMNPFLEHKILKMTSEVRVCLSREEPPGHPDNVNKCKSCGLYAQCHDEMLLRGLLDSKTSKKQ
jgi:CRISPR-associated protein Cas4